MNPFSKECGDCCTVVQSFYGQVTVIKPGFRREFASLLDAGKFIEEQGWKINITHIKGSPMLKSRQS